MTNCDPDKLPDLNLPADGEELTELRKPADGVSDGLVPLEALDLSRIGSADELLRAMSRTAFAGRSLGEAADVLEAMIRDPDCLVVCTLSGAMTIAKMGLLVCDMIEWGWVQAIVSTGALMAHGFVEAAGGTHFKHDPKFSDKELYEKGYDRVYDTLELEKSLDDVERIVYAVISQLAPGEVFGSCEFHRRLGEWLAENVEGRGILRSAFERDVPVYVPAFTDSELGLDVGLYLERCRRLETEPPRFDPFRDLEMFKNQILSAPRCGIFTIGGGVPRNWAQQVAPYLEISRVRLQDETIQRRRFRYGVRICPEPVHWGGLSGCTYTEGISWGKFLPRSKGGRFAEVFGDATIAWPILAMAMRERLTAAPPPSKSFL
jgi:deoxyhypusine synthase